MNITKIDFFSLDIENIEMEILKLFPFDEVDVDVWVIEHITSYEEADVDLTELREPDKSISMNVLRSHHGDLVESLDIIEFMEEKGYYYFDLFCTVISDYVFVKIDSEVFKKLNVPNDKLKRRKICDNKKLYIGEMGFVAPVQNLRDIRHYPNLRFS